MTSSALAEPAAASAVPPPLVALPFAALARARPFLRLPAAVVRLEATPLPARPVDRRPFPSLAPKAARQDTSVVLPAAVIAPRPSAGPRPTFTGLATPYRRAAARTSQAPIIQ